MNKITVNPKSWGLFDYAPGNFSLFSQGDFYKMIVK